MFSSAGLLLSGLRHPIQIGILLQPQSVRCLTKALVLYDSASSQKWLARQRADPYVRQARVESYRCRSAFKLLQLHERVPGGLLHPDDIVVDCGAAPGSWTQVATSFCTKSNQSNSGLVISFDLLDFPSVPGARCYSHTDVQDWEHCVRLVDQAIAEHQLSSISPGSDVRKCDRAKGANLVLSDMAPNASGIREIDIPAMMNLASAVLELALRVSVPGASLVIKLWHGPEADQFRKVVSHFYHGPWDSQSFASRKKSRTMSASNQVTRTVSSGSAVRFLKPPASRSDSAEIYLVAKGFQPESVRQLI